MQHTGVQTAQRQEALFTKTARLEYCPGKQKEKKTVVECLERMKRSTDTEIDESRENKTKKRVIDDGRELDLELQMEGSPSKRVGGRCGNRRWWMKRKAQCSSSSRNRFFFSLLLYSCLVVQVSLVSSSHNNTQACTEVPHPFALDPLYDAAQRSNVSGLRTISMFSCLPRYLGQVFFFSGCINKYSVPGLLSQLRAKYAG